jgi:hypothetical protein
VFVNERFFQIKLAFSDEGFVKGPFHRHDFENIFDEVIKQSSLQLLGIQESVLY